jgi:choline dehydrogenase
MADSDFVIVGAGSAGCALAARLSEDPGRTVTLIEAGGSNRHPSVIVPVAFSQQFGSGRDWAFETEPEPFCHDRRLFVPRGKGLGGSSAMNAMLYVRGRPLDYDLWERDGCPGWGWEGVEPYFLKSEDSVRGHTENHATGGPLRVEGPRSPRQVSAAFIESAEASGIPFTDDYNGTEQDGVSVPQVTQKAGRRWSSADAFLKPAMKRANLTVLTGLEVERVAIEDGRATGVVCRDRRGRERVVTAGREVVLAAGAIGSPHLLLHSGIGPASMLADAGIERVAESPGVGENLQDHPSVVCVWDMPGGGSLADAEKPKALLEWILRRTGPLTSSLAEGFAFVRSRPGLPAADIQFHFAPAYFVDHGRVTYEGHASTIGPVLVSPKSRGRLWVESADPAEPPKFVTNMLSEREDVDALVTGVEIARDIASHRPLAELLGEELLPGPAIEDREAIEEDLRERVETLYHPVGTCRMGSDERAVVDPELRVRGVDRLRVADASIMPLIPGGNTNAPSIMIGEKAADLIARPAAVPA